jgi:hypothetical protein
MFAFVGCGSSSGDGQSDLGQQSSNGGNNGQNSGSNSGSGNNGGSGSGNNGAAALSDDCENIAAGDYCVRFYDENLDLVEQIETNGLFSPSDRVSGTWYGADAQQAAAVTLSGHTNFYASPVKEVRTQEDLEAIAGDYVTMSGKYILTNDIVLDIKDPKGWMPLGDDNYAGGFTHGFTGIFNGNGYKISGLWIDRSIADETKKPYDYIGLFGSIGAFGSDGKYKSGVVKNLGVEIDESKGGIKGHQYVGGIAGALHYGSTIKNSYAKGKVSANYHDVGGLVGKIYADSIGGSSKIIDSYFEGSVVGLEEDITYVNHRAGGIVGHLEKGELIGVHSKGSVSNNKEFVGGIAGYMTDGNITNSYSTATVTGRDFVGGIAGYVQEAGARISNCYYEGNVTAKRDSDPRGGNNAGGIAGEVEDGEILNSYSKGNIVGAANVGGIVGLAESRKYYTLVGNSYSTANVSGKLYVGGIAGASNYGYVIRNVAINPKIAEHTQIGGDFNHINRINGFDIAVNTYNNLASEDIDIPTITGGQLVNGIDYAGHQFKSQKTYELLEWKFGNDVDNPWVMPTNGYPKFYWEK